MAPTVPIVPATARMLLGRALRLECPRCGRGALFERPWRMRERCPACGVRFEREQGYFVGAIYLNYAGAVGLSLGSVLVLDWAFGLPLLWQLVIGVGIALAAPLLGFRYARAFWLAIDCFVSQADERLERRR